MPWARPPIPSTSARTTRPPRPARARSTSQGLPMNEDTPSSSPPHSPRRGGPEAAGRAAARAGLPVRPLAALSAAEIEKAARGPRFLPAPATRRLQGRSPAWRRIDTRLAGGRRPARPEPRRPRQQHQPRPGLRAGRGRPGPALPGRCPGGELALLARAREADDGRDRRKPASPHRPLQGRPPRQPQRHAQGHRG